MTSIKTESSMMRVSSKKCVQPSISQRSISQNLPISNLAGEHSVDVLFKIQLFTLIISIFIAFDKIRMADFIHKILNGKQFNTISRQCRHHY